jgi:pilus assembly protein Flp/PilA
MNRLTSLVAAVVQEEDGQGMVEYALVLALVSVVAIGTLTLLGGNLTGIFNKAATSLKTN